MVKNIILKINGACHRTVKKQSRCKTLLGFEGSWLIILFFSCVLQTSWVDMIWSDREQNFSLIIATADLKDMTQIWSWNWIFITMLSQIKFSIQNYWLDPLSLLLNQSLYLSVSPVYKGTVTNGLVSSFWPITPIEAFCEAIKCCDRVSLLSQFSLAIRVKTLMISSNPDYLPKVSREITTNFWIYG